MLGGKRLVYRSRTVICLSVAVPPYERLSSLTKQTYSTVQQLLLVNSSSYDQRFTRPCVRKHRLCRHELQMASHKGRRLALLQKLVQPLC
jgi:hypothetical protein